MEETKNNEGPSMGEQKPREEVLETRDIEKEPEQDIKAEKKETKHDTDNDDEPINGLRTKVTGPEKVGEGLMSAHVEYTVSVKTSLEIYKKKEFNVLRRYSHFVWLREKLAEKNKGYLIPPLPEKALLNRFNAEFLEYRRRELESFLRRVTNHPVLSRSTELQTFLEADSIESLVSSTSSSSSSSGKTPKKEQQTTQSSGLFSFIGSSLETISSNFSAQNEPDQWFDAKKNYVSALETQLLALSKSTNALIKRQKEFGQIASLVASTEADQNQSISSSFNKLGEVSTAIASLEEKMVDDEIAYFEDTLRDYVRIIGAVKEMLSARNEKLLVYQSAAKQVEIKKDKAEKNKGSTKLEKELEEAQKKLEDSKREFDEISDTCKTELQRFEKEKDSDMLLSITKLTQTNINRGLQAVDQWKLFLAQMHDIDTSTLTQKHPL